MPCLNNDSINLPCLNNDSINERGNMPLSSQTWHAMSLHLPIFEIVQRSFRLLNLF
ncbi:MAG: hypothetical protein HDS84_07695 [Bacteroidales bacterium]|nr:hypothetical protein [Bacteroidales bacterium]